MTSAENISSISTMQYFKPLDIPPPTNIPQPAKRPHPREKETAAWAHTSFPIIQHQSKLFTRPAKETKEEFSLNGHRSLYHSRRISRPKQKQIHIDHYYNNCSNTFLNELNCTSRINVFNLPTQYCLGQLEITGTNLLTRRSPSDIERHMYSLWYCQISVTWLTVAMYFTTSYPPSLSGRTNLR
ncbi:uncharacterized protein H6S33_003038 [Morchella sextelata]|uniref:uncharacterized protein n=1 Tax=Morchella sextelata TaxID=1174677 RepID=UPI001D04F120|nr:uncharacterized protein H6S33_003038 [Morchella sextelata]KAH0607050.1 hypothetical protein H6S33_003038 [Morchella sextelata]